MGSLSADSEMKTELNDSGYIQDELTPQKPTYIYANLLDLSDDVLLYILQYCSPLDLKALGYSCSRLGILIRDRTLWTHVDARSDACGPARLQWLLAFGLNPSTTELMLSGFARETVGCPGYSDATTSQGRCFQPEGAQIWPRRLANSIYSMSEPATQKSKEATETTTSDTSPQPSETSTPLFTINSQQMSQINRSCNLTSLALEYCNIDCDLLTLSQFPSKLKKLSLRGTKCFNQRVDRSFLFRVSDYLPLLEYLDVSECQWMEPVSLMTLSKMAHLESLLLRDCHRLSEFVAYASLSTRYGFRKLKVLDLRGSPVGNSEVTALGWLPALEKLFLEPPKTMNRNTSPTPVEPPVELLDWEHEVPDYFKTDLKTVENPNGTETEDENNKNNDTKHNAQQLTNDDNNERESCKRKNNTDNTTDRPDSPKRQRRDSNPGTSKDNSDSDSDNDDQNKKVLIRRCFKNGVVGSEKIVQPGNNSVNGSQPSTSKDQNANNGNPADQPQAENFVRFRHNEMPILINCRGILTSTYTINNDNDDNENGNNDNENGNGNNGKENNENGNDDNENRINDFRVVSVEHIPYDPHHHLPRAHIVYVNVREQRHNICRLSIPNEGANNMHEPRHCPLLPFIRESDPATLITDIAIQHFGRADGDDVNYFRIGPPGPEPMGRPSLSTLRELSVNGYRNITDRSLVHLATAAPYLRRIDFSNTRVTQAGVDAFKALRPDVEVVFSAFDDNMTEEQKNED